MRAMREACNICRIYFQGLITAASRHTLYYPSIEIGRYLFGMMLAILIDDECYYHAVVEHYIPRAARRQRAYYMYDAKYHAFY